MIEPEAEGSELKIERAKHHIDDLNERLTAFLAKQPFKTVIRRDLKPGKRLLTIKEMEPIPVEFSLIIGDAVHNLRSALDILIFSLIEDKALQPKAVQFPFAISDGQSFENAIKNRQIKCAGKEIERAIRDLHPYENGNQILHGLHQLDIVDKHKLVITAGTIADLVADDAGKLDPMLASMRGPGVLRFTDLQDGILFSLPTFGRNRRERRAWRIAEQETKFQPSFSICFGKELPFQGQLVVPKLLEITAEVEAAVSKIRIAANR